MSKSVLYAILLFAAFWGLVGCSEQECVEEKPALMTLKINLGLSDALPQTRADESTFPLDENDDERMHTLRIIIVRPNGVVEKNEFVKLDRPEIKKECKFAEIVSGERKWIYLVVNEDTQKEEENGMPGELVVPYDFAGIEEGTVFPMSDVFNVLVKLNSAEEQLAGPLPMSDVYQVDLPLFVGEVANDNQGDRTVKVDLKVRRAAVKFTYYVTNESDKDFEVVGLEMEKMAREEYFFPREFEGDYFVVPSVNGNNEYYDFVHDFSMPVHLQAGAKEVALLQEAGEKPIYLLEGKYEDGDEDKNLSYRMALTLKNDELGEWTTTYEYFPWLPEYLRRNTHVVVHATIQHDLELKWEVYVRPYISVPLEPDFGL